MTIKVAVVHDYLTQRGGAERVALEIARAFPGAPIYTSFSEPAQTFDGFAQHEIHSSRWNKFSALRHDPRRAFPILASIFGRLEIDADIVICSSSGWSHGVKTRGTKIVYCHTPARWLWEPKDYFKGSPSFVRRLLIALTGTTRTWDKNAADNGDLYIANSTVVQERIARAYGIESVLLHPPAALREAAERIDLPYADGDFFLTVGRPRAYKNTRSAITAFEKRPERNLVVVGDGWIDGEAQSANITFLSGITDAELTGLYERAEGVIALSHEDFGLTPIEAFAAGTPVLALKAGGFLDTCIEGTNAVFVSALSTKEILDGVDRFDRIDWDRDAIRGSAVPFSPEAFRERLHQLVDEATKRAA